MKSTSTRQRHTTKYPYLAVSKAEDTHSNIGPQFRPAVVLVTSAHTGVVVATGSSHYFGEVGHSWNSDESELMRYNGKVTLSND